MILFRSNDFVVSLTRQGELLQVALKLAIDLPEDWVRRIMRELCYLQVQGSQTILRDGRTISVVILRKMYLESSSTSIVNVATKVLIEFELEWNQD